MGWLFAAFAIVWLAFFGYAFTLDRKQRQIADEIAGLKSRLSK
jgi:CcmD family protein